MALTPNQQNLIDKLENTTQLNGRYERLTCVNAGASGRRGVLSLVFKGVDAIDGSPVAIKFFDPARLNESYRIDAFEREPILLEKVKGVRRCLQICSGLESYAWNVWAGADSPPITIPCSYFATEWIEEDVDSYFLDQQSQQAIHKLEVFRSLLLGVEAIHRKDIAHRDIKVDNIRMKNLDGESAAVLIDFGTAARSDTPQINTTYTAPVGAPAFAPPEAFVGFTGNRRVATLADSYALGALLFDLFNLRAFHHARSQETEFDSIVLAGRMLVLAEPSEGRQLDIWMDHAHLFRHIAESPEIDGAGHSIPMSIQYSVKRAYSMLSDFNCRDRTMDLARVRRIIDGAIRNIWNSKKQAKDLERKRRMRERRKEKARISQDRLEAYLKFRRVTSA